MPALFSDDELAALVQAPVETATADLLRDLTSGLVEAATGRSYAADDAVVPPTVKAIALTVAARAYTNPNGLSGESVGSYSYSRSAAGARSGVFLTDEESRSLRKIGNARSGLSSLQITRGGDNGVYVEATPPGLPAPIPGSDASWPVPWDVDAR